MVLWESELSNPERQARPAFLFVRYFPDFARKGETASKIIHDTQLAREAADYRGEFAPAEEAQQAVQRAQSFVEAIARQFFPGER